MADEKTNDLSGVIETLVFPLYARALESRRPDALMRDEKAVWLVKNMDYDFTRIGQVKMDADDRTALILRSREFDGYVRDFLSRQPEAVVVHIGCGLDTRFERVDDGRVEWFDLDMPEVIELRRKYIGDEADRYHLVSSSAFDLAWLGQLRAWKDRPFLFLAEGVFMYFHAEKIKSLVLELCRYFPGSELVFDAFSPYLVKMNNLRFSLTHFGARYHWALKKGSLVECWGKGITLLDEWSYFDRPEPRLDRVYWMRRIPFLARTLVVYHFRLGVEAGEMAAKPREG